MGNVRWPLLPRLLATGVGMAALAAGPARAQDGAAADKVTPRADPASETQADAAIRNEGLADIVVTAERRDQRLQDVPISATVLNANDIASRGVRSISDLQQVAPSVAISTFNRSTFINIRGVGIAVASPASNPGVAYYVDGQLIPHETLIGLSFFDFGSIEVLRGPQGTLTGQNSTGGAIYVRTPEPAYGQFSGYLDQTIGNYGQFRTAGAVNFGLGDAVAIRVSAVHDQRDSFTRNIGPSPAQPGNGNLDAVRGNLAFRTSDAALRVNLRAEYFNSKTDNVAVKNRADAVTADPFTIEEDAESVFDTIGYRVSGEVKYAITDRIDVRGLSSWQDAYTFDLVDGDRTATAPPRNPAANIGRVTQTKLSFKTFINEVNLMSTGRGAFQWVVGGFVLDERVPLVQYRDNFHTVTFVSSTQSQLITAYNNSKSLFGQGTYAFGDRFDVVAGARYSWDKQVYDRLVGPGGVGATIQQSKALTGKLALNYHVDRATLLYVSASRGYKAGGGNIVVTAPSFRPEKNTVYEVGFKTTLLNNRLRINGDVFHSDYKDIQLQSVSVGQVLIQNAASGRSNGAELEVTGRFGGFSLNLGASYLDAQFAGDVCLNDSNNPAGNRTRCPIVNATQADSLVAKGSRLPFSPKWTFNGGVQYAVPIGRRTLTPRLQWAHLDGQIVTPFASARTVVDGRDIIDARLTLDVSRAFLVEAFVSNLTDEVYIASQPQDVGSAAGGYVYGAPRQAGARAVFRW